MHGVEPLQHRFAYVGSDLQDLYGVRPRTIGAAGRLQDGWFGGGTATGLMRTLAATPDGVLVSAETVKDFQLHPGDTLRLRMQDGRSKRFMTIPFRYVGVAKEFPTAPKDSFFVANAGYVAQDHAQRCGRRLPRADRPIPWPWRRACARWSGRARRSPTSSASAASSAPA